MKDENPNPTPQRIRQAVSLALPDRGGADRRVRLVAAHQHASYSGSVESGSNAASQAATPPDNSPSPHDLPPGHPGPGDSDSLLQQMAKDTGPDTADLSGPVATTAQLEAQYSIIADSQEQLNKIRSEVAAAAAVEEQSRGSTGYRARKTAHGALERTFGGVSKRLDGGTESAAQRPCRAMAHRGTAHYRGRRTRRYLAVFEPRGCGPPRPAPFICELGEG